MKKQVLVLMMIIISSLLLLAGCGSDESKQEAKKAVDEMSSADSMFENNGALIKVMDELRNSPELKGKDVKIFQSFEITQDMLQDRYLNNIKIFISIPNTKEKVFSFEYSTSQGKKWSKPVPIKLVGDGELNDNLISFDDIHMENIPAMCQQTREKAQELKNLKVFLVKIDLERTDLQPYWMVQFNGQKGDAMVNGHAKFNLNGNMTYYYQDDKK